jgi:RNA polymerase sigma factor (sigma-70 family)
MATAFRSGTLGLIQHLYDSGTCTGLSDARLLERFVSRREEGAFAALVARHGAMVLSTCQAVLKDPSAADDAFQATFVLLFRKAGSIRHCDALGGWLHRVAYRTALQARSDAARRRDVEKAACKRRVVATPVADDLEAILHQEIERLPERFRLPVVLCDLEGVTRDQAADLLRATEGAVRGRLAKGRELLRRRLTRRGITLAVSLAIPGDIPASLGAATVRAAGGGASGAVGALATSASRGWAFASLKAALAAMVALGAATAAFVYVSPETARLRRPKAWIQSAVNAAVGPRAPAKAAATDDATTIRIDGRIVDLEGRPVSGASISVKFIQSPPDGKLDAWIDEVKRLGKQPFGLSMMTAPGPHLPFSATTGRDGRFRIEGLPRDGIVTAGISGPGIETSEVYILTRDVPTIRVKKPDFADGPMLVYYGARLDHVAANARPIVGMVRDKDTGAPIAGVHITGMPNIENSMITTPGVEATSDAQGRYKVTGLPTSRGFKLFTEAGAGQPYVNGGFVSPASEPKAGPVTFDMALKRGVVVRGRLTDKATGKPVQGAVCYYAFPDNSHLDEYPNFKRGSQITRVLIPGSDGRFTIAALPGRGLITARAPEEGYLHGLGAAAIKGFDRRMGAFPTHPFFCSTSDQHVLAEINPATGTREVTLELQVDPGRTVRGTIVGPDGQAWLGGGVEIHTLDVFQSPQQTRVNSAAFVVAGLPSGRYRLDFIHSGRKLAGSITLNRDETDSLTAKLEPWGTVIGRVVDEEGKPRTDVQIFSTIREPPDPKRGDLSDKPTVNGEGRFRIEGLVPGVKYDALGHSPQKASGPILKGVQVAAGETKDVGDVKLPAWKPDQN